MGLLRLWTGTRRAFCTAAGWAFGTLLSWHEYRGLAFTFSIFKLYGRSSVGHQAKLSLGFSVSAEGAASYVRTSETTVSYLRIKVMNFPFLPLKECTHPTTPSGTTLPMSRVKWRF